MVEGEKIVDELLHSDFRLVYIVATADHLSHVETTYPDKDIREITGADYQKMSSFSTPPGIAALLEIPVYESVHSHITENTLYLDGIKDPGNLGTLIRIADWYGINDVFCSEDTVDWFNPKVLSATMGSIARVRVHFETFEQFNDRCKIPKVAMVMNGEPLHTYVLPEKAAVMIGSESHGIHPEILPLADALLTIHKTGAAESLNAGIAAAIVCDRLVNR